VWNDIVLITLLESLLKKYDVRKNHFLNQKETTMTDAQQILIFKEVWIKADREVDLKFDHIFSYKNSENQQRKWTATTVKS
jgi:hypothetical protein